MSNNFSASVDLKTGNATKNIRSLVASVNTLSTSLEKLNKTIKDGNGDLASIASSMKSVSDATREGAQASKELASARAQEAKATQDKASAEKNLQTASAQSAKADQDKAKATSQTASASTQAAKASSELASAQRATTSSTKEATDAIDNQGLSLASHRYLMYDVGATYRTLSAILLAVPAATSAVAVAYEKDFAQVQRTTGLAGDAAEKYHSQLRNLATEIPVTFSELSELSKIGGQMGIAQAGLEDFTATVAKFVRTSDGATIDKSAEAFGRLENMFNKTPTGAMADENFFRRIGSAISYTADNSVTTEAAIISMLDKTAASAKAAGLSIQQTIGLSSAMASSGLQPFLSSGFVVRFFSNFTKAAAEGGDAVKQLAGELNMTADEFQNVVRNDPYQILHRVVSTANQMDSVAQNSFLSRLGINGVQDPKVINALSANLHVLDKAMVDVNDEFASASYLDTSSAGIFDTTAANIQMLINSLMNLGNTVGNAALPAFTAFLKAGTTIVSGIDDLINSSKAAQVAFNILISAIGTLGAVLAGKSMFALLNASMVMFRDAASKGALTARGFGGAQRQLAEIMLYSKGATDAQVKSMLTNRTQSEAMKIAIGTQRAELMKLTGARQADIGALASHTAAQNANATAAKTATAANVTTGAAELSESASGIAAVGNAASRTAEQLADASAKSSLLRTALRGAGSMLSSFINPATLAIGAVVGLGASYINTKSSINEFNDSLYESLDAVDSVEGAFNAALTKMTERTVGFWDALWSGAQFDIMGDNMLEIFNKAGVTGEMLEAASRRGAAGYKELRQQMELVLNKARDLNVQRSTGSLVEITDDEQKLIDQLSVLERTTKTLKEMEDRARDASDSTRLLADNGVDVAEMFDETEMAADGAADSVDDFSKALKNAMDTVFGFLNAEGAMFSALERLGEGLHESADMSNATAEGISNIQNFQSVVTTTLEMMNQEVSDGVFATTQEALAYYTNYFQSLQEELINAGVDPAQAQTMVDMALDAMQAALNQSSDLTVALGIDPESGYHHLEITLEDMQSYIDAVPFEIILDADGQPATDTTWEVVNWIAEAMNISPEAVLNAIDGNATENTAAVWRYIMAIMNDEYTAALNADASAGTTNVGNFHSWAMDRLAEISSGINMAGAELSNIQHEANLLQNSLGIQTNSQFGPYASGYRFDPRIYNTPSAPTQVSAYRANSPNAPARPNMAAAVEAPNIPKPDFSALNRGYDNAAKKAAKAGGAGKKAGKDASKGAKKAGDAAKKAGKDGETAAEKAARAVREWNKEYQDLSSWAGRVGEALDFAFNNQHAVQSALDAYYSQLNSINDRLKQQRQRVADLTEETKKLNAERRVELNEAEKFERMAKLAEKHGNTERAKDYSDQAKAMRERAAEMQNTISANKAEQNSINAGMNNLKGYTQAAIDNRNELRQLERAALQIPVAYASIGASASTVRAQTVLWTNQVKTHATQMGYTNTQVSKNTTAVARYIAELKKVPRTIPTQVTASLRSTAGINSTLNNVARGRTSSIGAGAGGGISTVNSRLNNTARGRSASFGAAGGSSIGSVNNRLNNTARGRSARISPNLSGNINTVNSRLNNAARNRTSTINVRLGSLALGPLGAGLNMLLRNQGGIVPGFNSGGLIPGDAPKDPKEDNLLANVDNNGLIAVRSKEFIIQQPAVEHYGLGIMEKINKMKLPKYWAGGSPGGSSSGNDMPMPVDLSAKTINQIGKAVSTEVNLRIGEEKAARAVERGLKTLNAKRGNF